MLTFLGIGLEAQTILEETWQPASGELEKMPDSVESGQPIVEQQE